MYQAPRWLQIKKRGSEVLSDTPKILLGERNRAPPQNQGGNRPKNIARPLNCNWLLGQNPAPGSVASKDKRDPSPGVDIPPKR